MLLPIALCVVAIAAVGVYFQHALSVRDRQLPEEAGQSRLFEEHCGARVERGRNFTAPFVRLTVYEEFLVVNCLDYRRSIRYEDIGHLSDVRTVLGRGLELAVRDPEAPTVTLWVRDVKRVRREISAAAKRHDRVV
ncbi:MAG: hypothetical protein ABI779_00695 [Acidobacteriota bacterium]